MTERIGRYEVEEEIARGGMGTIYRVRDGEMRRFLAMKVLRVPDNETPESTKSSKSTARFVEEAQVTGQLDHPGIVPVHEMGRDGEGRLFFTMPLVKGETLDEVFAHVRDGTGGWTLTRALAVVQKVCEAMAFAHDRNVVHRDLKPANVMVGRFGETYVMDWGLAKIRGSETQDFEHVSAPGPSTTVLTSVRQESSTHDQGLATLDGDIVGTPAYMSPEQARGLQSSVGTHSDVYSVGALLYHLLNGNSPYVEDGEKLTGFEVLQRVLAGPPQPLGSDVPGELVAICETAMARDYGDRYADMLAMSADLQAFIEGRVVRAYRTGAWVEFRKWVQRNRGMAASLAAALVLAVAGPGATTWVQLRAKSALMEVNSELSESNVRLDKSVSEVLEANVRAKAQENEARWQSYAANVAVASAGLDSGAASDAQSRLDLAPEEFRGFEWSLLRAGVDTAMESYTGEDFIVGVAFSPDGRFLSVRRGPYGGFGEWRPRVEVRDGNTREVLHVLDGHSGQVADAAFSPSGSELATVDAAETVRVWDAESGRLLASRSDWGDGVRVNDATGRASLAYDPAGLRILVAWDSGVVSEWDLLDDKQRRVLERDARLMCMDLTPDGRMLALGDSDFMVSLHDVASGAMVGEWRSDEDRGWVDPTFQHGVLQVRISDDGGELLAAASDGDVRIWPLIPGGGPPRLLRGHHRPVYGAEFHPTQPFLATIGLDGVVRYWDRSTGAPLESLPGHDAGGLGIAFHPDGTLLVTGGFDSRLRVWDGRPGAVRTVFDGGGDIDPEFYLTTFDSDGRRLAWSVGERAVRVGDTFTGLELLTFGFGKSRLRGLAFDTDGESLYTLSELAGLRQWDAQTGDLLLAHEGANQVVTRAAFHTPSRRLASCVELEADRYAVELRDLDTGDRVALWGESEQRATGVAFTPDGSGLFVIGREGDQSIGRLLDIASGRTLVSIAIAGEVTGLEVKGWGERLAAAIVLDFVEGGGVRVFDLESGEEIARSTGSTPPSCVTLHPDGERFATGNWDNSLSIWGPTRGELLKLKGHHAPVVSVAFDPTGQRLVSAAFGRRHLLWETVPVRERKEARARAAREVLLEPRLTARVQAARERRLSPNAVAAELRADATLTSFERDVALRMARVLPFDPQAKLDVAWDRLDDPELTPADLLDVLAFFEFAAAGFDRLDDYPASVWLLGLGASQYRMGRYAEALVLLERADRAHAERRFGAGKAPDRLYLAMALTRAGRSDEAFAVVEGIAAQLEQLEGRRDPNLQSYLDRYRARLAEARSLLESDSAR